MFWVIWIKYNTGFWNNQDASIYYPTVEHNISSESCAKEEAVYLLQPLWQTLIRNDHLGKADTCWLVDSESVQQWCTPLHSGSMNPGEATSIYWSVMISVVSQRLIFHQPTHLVSGVADSAYPGVLWQQICKNPPHLSKTFIILLLFFFHLEDTPHAQAEKRGHFYHSSE